MLNNDVAAPAMCPIAIALIYINGDDVVAVGTIVQLQKQDSPILFPS